MIEFLFCPQHGVITTNWPMIVAFGAVAKVYANRVIIAVMRWF